MLIINFTLVVQVHSEQCTEEFYKAHVSEVDFNLKPGLGTGLGLELGFAAFKLVNHQTHTVYGSTFTICCLFTLSNPLFFLFFFLIIGATS